MEKLLTFDCYGTLLDTSPLYDHIASVAASSGLPSETARTIFVNYEDRLMYGEAYLPYDRLLQSVLEYCDCELNTDVFAPEWPHLLSIHQNFRPFDDVPDTLRVLRERGYSLALMSNTTHALMDFHLKALGPVFGDLLLAEDTHCYKPDISFFQAAAHRWALPHAGHCHIAAGYWWDMVPCSKLNWPRIWVNRRGVAGNPRHQPYQEIRRFDELKDLLL